MSGARLVVADLNERRLQFCRDHFRVHRTLAPDGDMEAVLRSLGGGELPTVVIDATGHAGSMARTFDLAAHGGRIVFVGLIQGEVAFSDPNFHRRELTLCASRNAPAKTFRDIIQLIEAGKVDTRPWITHRFPLADTPEVFARQIAGNPAVLKAMVTA
jgi:threonine dehydrogenase-like Zn-dependent dehydrogenase